MIDKMKNKVRIIIVPGGDVIEFHKNRYSKYFSRIMISLWRMKFLYIGKILHAILQNRVDWILHLQKRLGGQYSVQILDMPYRHFAKYSEWKMSFEKSIQDKQGPLILIGYSLWWNFLVKYISENKKIHSKIKHIFLVGTFYNITNPIDRPEYKCFRKWYTSNFQFNQSQLNILSKFSITFYQWSQDCIVSPGNFHLFQKVYARYAM